MNNNILSLLGLALRGGRLAVGEEPAALAAKAGQARLLLLASDAAGNTVRRAEHLAQEGHCLYLALPFSKAELGGALGRGSAAIAALTDTGLAAALTERLAVLDPEQYAGAAERMKLKLQRAKERKAAPRRRPPPKPRREDGQERRARPRDGDARSYAGRRSKDGTSEHRPYGGKDRAGKDRPCGGRGSAGRFRPGGGRASGRPFAGDKRSGGPPGKRRKPGGNSSAGGNPAGRGR